MSGAAYPPSPAALARAWARVTVAGAALRDEAAARRAGKAEARWWIARLAEIDRACTRLWLPRLPLPPAFPAPAKPWPYDDEIAAAERRWNGLSMAHVASVWLVAGVWADGARPAANDLWKAVPGKFEAAAAEAFTSLETLMAERFEGEPVRAGAAA